MEMNRQGRGRALFHEMAEICDLHLRQGEGFRKKASGKQPDALLEVLAPTTHSCQRLGLQTELKTLFEAGNAIGLL